MRSAVRPSAQPLTDADARKLLSAGLIRACAEHGPSRVALHIGCDEKTVRRARDAESTLGLACAVNLIGINRGAWDELLASQGYRLSSLSIDATVDAIVAQSASIHRIAAARDPNGPGGVLETDCELIGMEAEIDAALASLEAVKARIVGAKLRRAA